MQRPSQRNAAATTARFLHAAAYCSALCRRRRPSEASRHRSEQLREAPLARPGSEAMCPVCGGGNCRLAQQTGGHPGVGGRRRMLAGGGELVAVALQYIVTPPTTQNLTHVWGQLLGRPLSDITAQMGLRLDVNYVSSVSTIVWARLPPPLTPLCHMRRRCECQPSTRPCARDAAPVHCTHLRT